MTPSEQTAHFIQATAQIPLTGQTVDKLLSLDPLTLAMLVILAVVIGMVAKEWFDGKSKAATDAQQSAVIKFLTDENSPMVISHNRIADAIELGNKRSEEWAAAVKSLATKTDEQTTHFTGLRTDFQTLGADFRGYTSTASGAIEEFRADMDTQHEETKASIAALKADIDTHMEGIAKDLSTIKDDLQNRKECADTVDKLDKIKAEWDSFRTEVLERLKPPTVATITLDNPPADLPKSA